jgi:hypothetical protein
MGIGHDCHPVHAHVIAGAVVGSCFIGFGFSGWILRPPCQSWWSAQTPVFQRVAVGGGRPAGSICILFSPFQKERLKDVRTNEYCTAVTWLTIGTVPGTNDTVRTIVLN